ncbi:MAG: metallopeptidase family protein [Pseudomonadota bacterium]
MKRPRAFRHDPPLGETDLDAFATIAKQEFDGLPPDVSALVKDVEIRISDWPAPEHLASVGVAHPLDLLGLFEGIGLDHRSVVFETGVFPNRIWLYREPILAFTADGPDTLRAVIRHVLVHELGHHFGLSDDDMYAIDDAEDDK